ncbi:S-layer homology domain-containing protein [Anaerotignum lactatifermentans]|uniref:S-layer homology domain-containing protein n=1 Tax=Anaerotignum lactatifermentans TaxID=160404 RepID=UPI002673A02B|nr:S-layer homology domain-containing protein [Anaerotignum lactatifermentans]
MRKRIFAAFVCLCMLMALVPSMAYAGDTVSVGGLCEHHPQHDNACGYSEGTAEVPCSHEHTEDCYTLVTNCVHEHMAECYSDGVLPAEGEEKTADSCSHQCSEESGCITKELNCNHEHDASCGYVPATEGTPCTYDCQICNTQTAEEAECICETKCTEEEPNADCPVCGGENGDISSCVGAAMMLAPMGAGAIEPEVPAGSGIEGDPYLITNAAELYWFANEVNNNYGFNSWAKLMDDITINENVLNDDGSLNGNGSDLEPWTPINNPYSPYTGTFDGDNHKISGLYVNSADSFVGLFGNVGTNGTIKNVGIEDSYFSSTWFSANVGSVCGKNNGGTIENCYNTGAVSNTGSSSYAGGVCGQNFNGTIKNSYNTGTVSNIGNSSYAGGVCGDNYYGTIENSYNTGAVSNTGTSPYVGGVCGYNRNKIENSYNTGIVTAKDSGLFANVGGVCGHSGSSATITSCYYLKGTAESSDGGDVLTESQFGEQNSFSGWDFGTVWQMNAILGRPVLQSSPEVEGTEEEPYLIYNAEELKGFRDMVNSGNTDIHAKLMDDITINENVLDENGNLNGNGSGLEQWTPIGSYGIRGEEAYIGTFDGNGHTISGLYVDSDAQNVGLFGCVGTNGKIQNVGVVDSYISATANGAIVGGVCGRNYRGTIENCYNTGTVTGSGINVGGVCGGNSWNIINCYNTGKVSTTDDGACVGGVCGYNTKNIKNCYNTGKISVTIHSSYVGGVCGMNFGGINNCYFLTGTADKGIGVGSSIFPNEATEKTENQFKSGEVAWLLNGSQNPQLWGQGSNGIPVLVDNLPKDVTCTAPVRVTIQMPDGTAEQYGYTTARSTLATYPNGYVFFEDDKYTIWIDKATKTYDVDTTIYAALPVNNITLNKTELSLYVNSTETLTAIVSPDNAYNKTLHWESSNPSVATVDSNGNVKAISRGEAVITATAADGQGAKAECTVTVKKKSSGGSVFFWDLKFDTNGGSKINTVTEWEYSTIDLDEYVPEKEGYKFVGWYADKDFDKKIDEVYLTKDTTVYAKWEKIAEEVPEETEEVEETETLSFKDVKESDWFYKAVSYAVENGLMSGMSEDIFAPNTPLTREMLAVVLYNVEGQPESAGVNPFIDVKADMWYTDAILWANENGIVAGYDNGAYGVGDFITREQFAAILYRYAQFKGYDVSIGADTNILSYADAFAISEYAYPAMQWACGAGIMGGMDDGTLMPQGKATRAEAATMLMNFCKNVVK